MPFIVVMGDSVIFDAAFSGATVVVQPGTMLAASGRGKAGAAVCVVGDEASVLVAGCTYTTTTHSTPGVGILSIESLGDAQKAGKVKSGGKQVILADGDFTAKFQVATPAQQPAAPNPIPDTTTSYSGTGHFESKNQRARAT